MVNNVLCVLIKKNKKKLLFYLDISFNRNETFFKIINDDTSKGNTKASKVKQTRHHTK